MAWKEKVAEQEQLSGYEQIEQPLHSGPMTSETAWNKLIDMYGMILKYIITFLSS